MYVSATHALCGRAATYEIKACGRLSLIYSCAEHRDVYKNAYRTPGGVLYV